MNKERARQVKFLTCVFLLDVLCSFRKTDDFRVMDRCMECRHYLRFSREMQEQEEKFFAFEEDVRKYGWDEAEARKRKRRF